MATQNDKSQTQQFVDRLPETPQDEEQANKPRMPFKTSYVLDRLQEDELCRYVSDAVEQMSKQLGRDDVLDDASAGSGAWGQGVAPGKIRKRGGASKVESWMGKRARYTARYENNVDDRVEPKTLFEHSNLTASLSQRIVRQMVARAVAFFFGQPDDTDWFTTEAVGEEDQVLADKIKKHSRWKVDQCQSKKTLVNSFEYAFVRGEAVVKPTHQQRFQIYKRTSTILVDAQGQPVLDANGDYIVQGDAFVDEMAPAEPDQLPTSNAQLSTPNEEAQGITPDVEMGEPPVLFGSGMGMVNEGGIPNVSPQSSVIGPPPAQPTERQVLKRDGVTVLPEVPIWQQQEIARKLIKFEGPDTSLVYYKDFLCGLAEPDIQTAPIICHLYDMDLMRVAQMFSGQFEEGDGGIADFAAAVQRLKDLAANTNQPKAAAKKPRREKKEQETDAPDGVAVSEFAECWLTYSKDGDGMNDEILVILDRRNKAPIYYEYAANVTVRGDRPFYVVRPMNVDGRWWGMGGMEYFDSEQEPIDLMVNRHNFATGKSGRVTFWRPYNTLEGDANPNLILNDGGTYTPKPGMKDEDVLSYVTLPYDSERFEFLLNFYMQLEQTKSGVLNSADQEMSGLPSNQLATGINEIRDSGQELFSLMLMELFASVKAILLATIDIIYANMNKTEVFSYFNGEANEILQLTPDEVRDLTLNVALSLTRSQKSKAVEMGQNATGLIGWFYGLPPELQLRVAQFARNQLKAFGVPQADKVIEPVPPMVPPDGGMNGSVKDEASRAAESVGVGRVRAVPAI